MDSISDREYLLESIFEYCNDLITIKDNNLRYIACNRAFLSHIGIKNKSEVINKSIYEILPPETAQKVEKNFKIVSQTLETRSYTIKLIKNNQNKIVKQTSAPIIREGRFEGILSISYDVTKEENLKIQLIEKICLINTLLYNIPLLVYLKDNTGRFVLGTKNSRKFVEEGFDSFSGIHIDIQKSNEQTEYEDKYVLQNKKILRKEKTVLDYNGNQHWYKIDKVPVLKEEGEVAGIVTITKNIDAEKRLEIQRDLFLATLTHDLKNPILAQISSLELLYNGSFGQLSQEQKELLAIIIESSKYMKEMLYSFLVTCKDNYGIIRLNRVKFDIEKLVKKSIKEIKNLASGSNIKIEYKSNLKKEEKLLFADEYQIRRVIGNLLNNGISYSDKKSVIRVYLSCENGSLILSVESKGTPISENMKKHIFDKYVCEEYNGHSGIGLGLYFCRKAIEAHEGNIELFSEKDKNKFVIQIPYLDEKSIVVTEIVL